MNRSLLEARRLAQEITRLHRHIRHPRKRGKLGEAEAAAAAFRTEHVIVVPSDKGQKQPSTR